MLDPKYKDWKPKGIMAISLQHSREDTQSKNTGGIGRSQETEPSSLFLRESEHFTEGMSKFSMLRTPQLTAYRTGKGTFQKGDGMHTVHP